MLLLALLAASCFHFPGRPSKAKPARTTASQTTVPGGTLPAAAGIVRETAAAAAQSKRLLPGHRIGTVRTVGTGGRFVLVEIFAADNTTDISDGQELRCVHPDTAASAGPAAIVRISPEHRPPFVVADVLEGEPHTGDEVYFVRGGRTAPPPVPTPPVTSFLVPTTLFPVPASSPSSQAIP